MTLRHVTGRRAVHEKVRMPDGSVRYKCDLCNVALTSNQGGHSVDKKSCMLENLKIPKSFPNFGGQNLKILRMVYSLIETNKDRTQETCGRNRRRGIFCDPWLHWTHVGSLLED